MCVIGVTESNVCVIVSQSSVCVFGATESHVCV